MNDMIFDDYQNLVNNCLIRHNNILDVITKFNETNSKINRAVAKSINNCGCINVNLTSKTTISDKSEHTNTCDDCREIIETEIGNNLFYLTSLCNLLNINLYDIIIKEYDKMKILGKFNIK